MNGWTAIGGADAARVGQLVNRRILLLAGLMLLALALILARYGQLQLIDAHEYASQAENNRIRLRAIAPNRGLIFDRNGIALAENRPAYRLVMVRERVPELDPALDAVAALVGLDREEREQVRLRVLARRPFQPVVIKPDLSADEVARLALERHRLDGLEIEPYLVRHYPYGEALAHVLGYVARLDEADLARLDGDNYRATTHTGKLGLEREYEHRLHGTTGFERVETNAQGRTLRVLERRAPVPGDNLHLGLDLSLQLSAIEALGDLPGAVVVLDVATGQVLALVSKPGFDPNRFVNGISHADYRALLESRRRPLFNRFLNGGYEPGSTLKPFIALAGLEAGVISPATRVFSSGAFRLPGHSREYRDWRKGGHGWVDLSASLEQSVNTYFYELAHNLGIDAISRELALFGFGQATGIDLPGEYRGVLPSRAWKQRTLNQAWFPGETVITGIGQGFMVATPLQLAQATAMLAARGRGVSPRLVRPEAAAQRVQHATAHWDAVFEGLHAVVHGSRGTARAIRPALRGVEIAGKTGTAQVFTRPEDEARARAQDELPWYLRNHALFIAFAPWDAPRVAIVVVVEHGGGGASVAAPVAAEVLPRALQILP
ncbi:MAG: penicillin-binding protein 2 [Wenzhouxiangellaceae bacterium]|nr:penicillin-binding protein 2 [Wenzhouxiangellaceae bacterium]